MSVKFGDNNINPNIDNPTLEATIAKPSVNISFNAPAINAKGKGTVILENPQFFIGNVETLDAGEDVYCYLTGTRDAPVLNFGIPMGFKGDTGAAATVTVGTTSTGAAGTSASVTNVGTSSAAVLNFVIPKGDTGAAGADGKDGSDGAAATIAVGTVTTGQPTDPASVTNVGTSSAAVFDFVIPKGDKGDTGSTGSAATIAVGTTTTGAAGTSASVTNSGTSSAAVFNFTIPKGDKGDTGPAGTTDYNDLANKPTIPSTAADVGALPDTTKYALSTSVGGSAKNTEGIPYGIVDGTSTATAFTATVPGITELKDGTIVMLKNGVITSASGFTINVNNLGAKPVYSNMATGTTITRETTIFNINYTLLLVYSTDLVEGGCWINYRGYNSDTNTIGYQVRTNSTVMKTADKSRYYRLFFTSADGTHRVPANTGTDNSATSAKTVNQRPIDPFGKIIYFSYTTSMAAEADVPAAYCWEQYAFVLGYSFNKTGAALTLTTKTPVYIKCAPQTDGSAIIDSTTPYVQALPSTADGKIYIFLGIAYSATNVELAINHPVYYHDGTAIRLWTGKAIPTKTSELTNDSGFLTSSPVSSVNGQTGAVVLSIPSASSSTPSDLGTASAGSASTFSRSDHVHNSVTTGFTVTLSSASWSSNEQTVSDAKFVASGYAYMVSPASTSIADYIDAGVYADDVTTNGSMTFHCVEEPTSNLTVNIVRAVS